MKTRLTLSIIIPCLNEEKTIGIVVTKALNSLKKLHINGEVVVADNGSNDRSKEISKILGARVIDVPERGYGNALIYGMKSAKGDYLLMADADDSYNLDEIQEFIKYIPKYELIIGSRLKGKIEANSMPFLHRYLGTPVLTFIVNQLFQTKISDCNSGMRCISKEAFEKMQLKSEGMEFASEMIIKAGVLKLKIKEISINFYKDKRDKKPHLRTWRDGWRHLKFMLIYSPKYLFFLPGAILITIGFLLTTVLASGPVYIAGRIFDFHFALLGSLFVLLGFQIVNTSLYASIFAYRELNISNFSKTFYKLFSLEKVILLGFATMLVGGLLDLLILFQWIGNDFGNLHQPGLVSLASTLIIIGFQTIFNAFFLDFLKDK